MTTTTTTSTTSSTPTSVSITTTSGCASLTATGSGSLGIMISKLWNKAGKTWTFKLNVIEFLHCTRTQVITTSTRRQTVVRKYRDLALGPTTTANSTTTSSSGDVQGTFGTSTSFD